MPKGVIAAKIRSLTPLAEKTSAKRNFHIFLGNSLQIWAAGVNAHNQGLSDLESSISGDATQLAPAQASQNALPPHYARWSVRYPNASQSHRYGATAVRVHGDCGASHRHQWPFL